MVDVELNGPESYGGGAPWLDDYLYIVPAVGMRAEMSHRAYSEVAVMGGGVDVVNLSKDQLEGPARLTAKVWGFTWNLTAVSQRRLDGRGWKGPGGAILSSSADKVLKFGDLLTLMEVERSEGGSRSEGGGALGGRTMKEEERSEGGSRSEGGGALGGSD